MAVFPSRLKGVFTALVTPFDVEGHISETVLRTLIDRQIENGVSGVFIAGSLGEFFSLSNNERIRLFNLSVEAASGRCSVMAHAGSLQLADTIELCQAAAAAGVDAISVITPFYVRYTQMELYSYYARLLDEVDVPVLAYNIPALTGINLSSDILGRLASRYSNFVGVKDSTGDLSQIFSYISALPSTFGIYNGNDTSLLGAYAYGAVGCVSATANIVPDAVQKLYNAFKGNDIALASACQMRISELRTIYRFGSVPAVPVKAALRAMGFDVGQCRSPLDDVAGGDVDKIKEALFKLKVLG